MVYISCLTIFPAKFDLPAIIGLIYGNCKRNDIEFSTIKKGTKYITGQMAKRLDGRSRMIVFRDCLNYTAPCSLDKYCRQWGAQLEKSIFPYSLYHSIEELKQAVEFPSFNDFWSDLKQVRYNITFSQLIHI